jgi:putative transposase
VLNNWLREEEMKATVKYLVEQVRSDHPTMALRTIHYKMRPRGIGRDRFELIAMEMGFGVEYKRWRPRTTDSSGVIRFPNLLSKVDIKAINQAWTSDITYYELENRFYFLTFILDYHSRRILGHSTSQTLRTEDTLLASMKKAVRLRGKDLPEGIIFHSDGGGQYYSKAFLELTKRYKFRNSMCEMAYENGRSERINGIIKNSYLRHWSISNFTELQKAVDRAVRLYNHDKPHKALHRRTPIEFENECLILQQRTKPTMTKSFDAIKDNTGHRAPIILANKASESECNLRNLEGSE